MMTQLDHITPYAGVMPYFSNFADTDDPEGEMAIATEQFLKYVNDGFTPEFNTQFDKLNILSAEIADAASTAGTSAEIATSAAATAQSTANAALWVSGQAYTTGQSAISTVNFQTYRANTNTNGTTDPSTSAYWTQVEVSDSTKLPLAGGTMTGALILAGDAADPLEAVTKQQLDLALGKVTGFYPEQFVMDNIYTSSTTVTVPSGATSCMAYVFGKGGDGVTGTSSGGGGGCAYGLFNVTPGEIITLTLTNSQGGTSKLTYGGVDLLVAVGANNNTAGTASKNASVTYGGAYSGGAGAVAASASGASSGSPFGAGKNGVASIGRGGSSWTYQATSYGGAGLGSGGANQVSGGGLSSNIKIVDPLIHYFKPFGGSVAPVASFEGENGFSGSGGGYSSSSSATTWGQKGGFGAGGGVGRSTTNSFVSGSSFGGGGASSYDATTGKPTGGGYGGGGGTGASWSGLGGNPVIVIFWRA